MTDTLHPKAAEAIPGRVARGVAWLDEHYPRWERDVKLTDFDMSQECRCVLGWVGRRRGLGRFHSFLLNVVYGKPPDGYLTNLQAFDFGFDARTMNGEAEYPALQVEWERVIRERRKS